MTLNKLIWRLISISMAVVILFGLVGLTSCGQSHLIEIQPPEITGEQEMTRIYIDGAVNIPGFYPLRVGDTVETLIQAAGGLTSGANLTHLKLHIPQAGEDNGPQKININMADAWLLEALPGIGPIRAANIINYRLKNGSFSNINELIRVEDIGMATYEQIKHLITVAD